MPGAGAGKVAVAAAILMITFVASRLLGLVREMVIAYFYGTDPALSAYLVAFRLPDLIFQLLASGAFASAFIPVFVTYLAKGRAEEAWEIASSAINLLGFLSLALAIVTALLAPWLVPLIVPAFSLQEQALTIHLTRIMLITPVFFGLSCIATAVLNARQHFLLPALAPLAYNLTIIAAAVLLSGPRGIFALAIGVATGSMLHLFVQLPALSSLGLRYQFKIDFKHPGVREVGRLLMPRSIGLGASQVTFLAYAFLASSLGPELYAALNYAWLLTMLPHGIIGISLSTAVFPTLADQSAAGDLEALRRTLGSALRLILFLSVPAAAGLILLREPLVGLLLERGRFGADSTTITAYALLFFAMGLFAHGVVEVVTRGFYALHNTRTPVALAFLSMGLNIALGVILSPFLGHGGLALGMSVATTLEGIALLVLLSRRLGGLEEDKLVGLMLRMLIASAVMVAAVLIVEARVPAGLPIFWERLVRVGAGAGMGMVVYLGAAYLLRSEELVMVVQRVRRGR